MHQLVDEPGQRSLVVIDAKGEVCAITCKYRRRVSDAKIINPYGEVLDERLDMASRAMAISALRNAMEK